MNKYTTVDQGNFWEVHNFSTGEVLASLLSFELAEKICSGLIREEYLKVFGQRRFVQEVKTSFGLISAHINQADVLEICTEFDEKIAVCIEEIDYLVKILTDAKEFFNGTNISI